MNFIKMHGLGNDYVYVNCFEERVESPAELAPVVSDRHTGIGSDGLILIAPSDVADVRMRMFNADGSEAQMCGHGIRWVAKYVYDDHVIEAVDLSGLGRVIENNVMFPERTNVHFVKIDGPGEITMRTWERGSGITMACGTGACACAVAGVVTGQCERLIAAHLPGGDLELNWCEDDNCVYMTGPATEVFRGQWPG